MEWNKLLFLAIGLGLYFILHSILANQKTKDFLMDGWISKRYYRLLYNLFALISLLPIAWYYMQIKSHFLLEIKWLSYVGLAIASIGTGLLFIALRQYDLSEFSGTQQLRTGSAPKSVHLKTSGFNAWVRHPLYFSGLLMFWAWFLFRPTDLFLVVALVSTIYLYIGTRLEEQKLIVEFGEAYSKYQQKVWMLVPFIKRNTAADSVNSNN